MADAMTRPQAGPPRGILNPGAVRQKITLSRQLAAPALRPLVEHYWIVRWDLRGEAPHTADTLPHPSVHWVTEVGRSYVLGIGTGRFTRRLEGRGRTFGVKFRPGGFYPFRPSPVSDFANAELTMAEAFGADGVAVEQELLALDALAWTDADDAAANRANGANDANQANDVTDPNSANDEQMRALIDRLLLARLPAADPNVDTITAIAERIMSDRDIIKVDDVVSRFGVNKRTLQRLFKQYVGVSPKWVIKRYRLHEAVERVAAGEVVNWSQLAADLGYFDQTHFIKDFKALVGKSPSEYVRSLTATARA
jgi:AraC-like DNA-binding protein